MNRGVVYAVIAYGLWGIFPLFWKTLQDVPAQEILSHRIIWSFALLLLIVLWRRRGWLTAVRQERRLLLVYGASALLLALNWLVYIWGVNAGFIIETSLGYFINPLVSVLFGMLFLQERLRPGQWLAIGLAFVGVVYLTVSYGRLPWIALTLAFSFGTYGLLRKKAPLPSLPALSLEMTLLFPLALVFLLALAANGQSHFMSNGLPTTLLLLVTGVITAVPLLLFGAATKRIHLSTIGILQYIAPTLQFLIGVYIYNEPFTRTRLLGFSIIWLALLIYALDGWRNGRRTAALNRKNLRLETGD